MAIGIAKTDSIVELANAAITTVGDLSINSKVDHTLNIEGKAENDPYKTKPVLGFGISVISSNSSATVGRQACLTSDAIFLCKLKQSTSTATRRKLRLVRPALSL